MPETEPAERTGSRAERSKRGRFAWEEKPKTENAFEDDYDFRTRTRIDKSETTKSAIDRSALPSSASFPNRNRPRSRSFGVVKSSLN